MPDELPTDRPVTPDAGPESRSDAGSGSPPDGPDAGRESRTDAGPGSPPDGPDAGRDRAPGSPAGDRPPARGSADRYPLPLLESLVGDHLDPGYQAAADRAEARIRSGGAPRTTAHGASGRSRSLAALGAGLVVIGVVLGVAATSTRDQAAGTDLARLGLRQDIDAAQREQSSLASRQTALAGQIRSAQAALGAGGPLQTVQELEVQGGQTAVTGPGLTVVIDGSTANSGAGVLLDRDVQLLVNGLWSAGAEAVSVGGVRLRTTSAIRQAGNAVLVDNRPVFWPIVLQAVGDPSTLHVKFVGTVGFGRFQTFVSLYGIRFDVTAQTALTLPAAGAPDLQYASPGGTPSPAAVSATPSAATTAASR